MSRFEQYIISYEDRDVFHTSRWLLEGVNTKSGGNTYRGWLFLKCVKTGDNVVATLYKAAACGGSDDVAVSSATDVSGIADAPVQITLVEAESSGITGKFFLESYAEDNADAVPVLVSLCTDIDLAEEWYDLSALPATVYDATNGMATHCAAATKKVLLLVSQMYAEELGGYGGREHVHYPNVDREGPDWRRLIVPDQLKDAATCWALELAFGSCHKLGDDTMYSKLRDDYRDRRKDAIGGWSLTFNTDPDSDEDADAMKSATAVRLTRI